MYLNSIQIIGFLGKDPERRQARANGANFTVLSVATQRSWKNAQGEWRSKTEWHRIVAWSSLGERVAAAMRKGDHVLIEGTLVSSTYEREYGKGKKATTGKLTSWQVRADVVRKLNQAEKKPEAVAAATSDDHLAAATSAEVPFRELPLYQGVRLCHSLFPVPLSVMTVYIFHGTIGATPAMSKIVRMESFT